MIYFRWDIAAMVLGAVITFALTSRLGDGPAYVFAVIGGGLAFKFARYFEPLFVWFFDDGFMQLVWCAVILALCIFTLVYSSRCYLNRGSIEVNQNYQQPYPHNPNNPPRMSANMAASLAFPDQVQSHSNVPIPAILYHGTNDYANALDLVENRRFISSYGQEFFMSDDFDYVKDEYAFSGVAAVIKFQVTDSSLITGEDTGSHSHFLYSARGGPDFFGYYPLKGVEPIGIHICDPSIRNHILNKNKENCDV